MVAGLLLGGFYAAVSLGVSLIFGLLDIANIAQPAFVILGSYAAYIGKSIDLGGVGIAFRLLVPCLVGLAMTLALHLFLSRTFYGRAVMAVSQDRLALRLMGADPVQIKTIAFGVGIAAASLAGALLITIAPVVPSTDRDYIGRMFAITVLGGMGSVAGTLVAAVILGVAESLMSTFFGPSWSLAVSFGILLVALAVRPAGLFGR